MESALVSGATGLLGKETIAQLVSSGVRVHAIIRDKAQAFREDVKFHEVDLSRAVSLDSLPEVDAIFHLSQSREFRDFPKRASEIFATNVASTAQLLEFGYRRGIKNFVYASSGGIYDPAAPQPLKEEAALLTPQTLGYYLSTKLSGESLAFSYANQFSVSVLRYFFIYGPNQARGMLIPRLFDAVRAQQPITLVGDEGLLINPVHVRDAAVATIAASTKVESAAFNVAGPQTLSLREIAELFGTLLGVDPVFDSQQGKPQDLVADIEKMSAQLHQPQVTLNLAATGLY